MMAFIKRALESMAARIRGQNERVIITSSDDSGPVRKLQLQGPFGKTYDGVEHLEPFGFSSNPPVGAEGFKTEVGGDPGLQGHPLVIVAFDRTYRITGLMPGESVVFNEWGDYVKFGQDRHIRVVANTEVDVTAPNVNVVASMKVTLQTPQVECTQNLKVDGNLEVDGTSDLKGAVTGEATITAPTLAGTTDVLIGPTGKSGVAHKHTGVTVGSGVSGGMQ